MYGPFTRRKPPHIRQVLMLATLDTARGLDHQQVLYGRLICIIINNESGFPIFRIVCWLDFHHGHGISRPRPNGRPSPTFFTSWFFVVVPIRSTFIISGNVVDRHAVAGSSPFPIFLLLFSIREIGWQIRAVPRLPFLFENVVSMFFIWIRKLSNDVGGESLRLFCCATIVESKG